MTDTSCSSVTHLALPQTANRRYRRQVATSATTRPACENEQNSYLLGFRMPARAPKLTGFWPPTDRG
jgi:hypothetical protein